jgi:aspartate 1-decarboxylase
MLRTFLNSKLHRARVTESDLNYVGSISIDRDLMDIAGLAEHEQVHVLDITNGNRLTTYVIQAPRGSGTIGINGAAAHLVSVDDLVIICSYVQLDEAEAKVHEPKIVLVNEENKILNENLLELAGYLDG